MSRSRGSGPDDDEEAVPAPRADGRRLGRLATSDGDINIRLLSHLAETAIRSGDVTTAVEAVRACAAQAENLYVMAAAERSAAAAATRAAAEEHARATAVQEAAAAAIRAAAEERARAMAMQEAAAAQQARAAIMHSEATALHGRAAAMREAANQAMTEAEALRRADHRKRRVPPRLRVTDANGLDLRPDPSQAQTPIEYLEAVRQFRVWAGNPSFRDIAKRCGGRPVASTICKILQGEELPGRFEPIDAIIIACGATDEDRQRFATAWRQLVMPERKARSVLRVLPGRTPA